MEKFTMDFNIGMNDRVNRIIVGSMLILALMVTDNTPAWIALAALYPVLTAIIAWDPVYAVFNQLAKLFNTRTLKKGGKLAIN